MHTLLTQTFCLMCNMQELYLNYNQIGDAGVEALAKAAGGGALASVIDLRLGSNQITEARSLMSGSGLTRSLITDTGVTALANAIKPVSEGGSGAMASLQTLLMDDGPLGVDHPKLKAACQKRGITLR